MNKPTYSKQLMPPKKKGEHHIVTVQITLEGYEAVCSCRHTCPGLASTDTQYAYWTACKAGDEHLRQMKVQVPKIDPRSMQAVLAKRYREAASQKGAPMHE